MELFHLPRIGRLEGPRINMRHKGGFLSQMGGILPIVLVFTKETNSKIPLKS